jgi:hypothetical protein
LAREYVHFVGRIGTKNDISFVIGSWMALLESDWFNNKDTVKIWSDGGPKHFKISANMKFLLALQQEKPEVDWEYNFFSPYHGCSVCDGVAAHAKRALNIKMRDEQTPIRTPEDAVTTIQQVGNHKASLVKLAENDFSTTTLKGIKKFFKFTAHKGKNYIYAFNDSSQVEYEKRFQPHEIVQLSEVMY